MFYALCTRRKDSHINYVMATATSITFQVMNGCNFFVFKFIKY